MTCFQKVTALRGGYFFYPHTLLFATTIIVGIVYLHGLSGPFLLDDRNLKIISEIGGVNDLHDLWRYLASDLSGLLGRPISNISFLANYSSWPTSPFPFKATNLAIHITVGLLLYRFIIMLLNIKRPASKLGWTALVVTAYWLLNPLNVSTTLYVVQRMTMLSALFVIAGLALYIYGRKLQAKGDKSGYRWMSAAIILATSLSILCKENGALLPLLALVMEYTVIRHYLKIQVPNRYWTLSFLWLPTIMVLLLLAYYGTPSSYGSRGFTLTERLLTECRVLVEYLYYWFNPFAVSRGVLASDYPISTSMTTPWQTLPALLAIIGTIIWALLQRKRYPIAALAILFFYVGHLMESTVVPLEIYFEHRNYLPAMLLVLPLVIWINTTSASVNRRLIHLLIIIVLSAQTYQTFRLTEIWGDELKLASWWSYHNPKDTRAQSFFANTLSAKGRPDLALQVIHKAILLKPRFSHYHLHVLLEMCKFKAIPANHLTKLNKQLSYFPLYKNSYPLLERIIEIAASETCKGFSSTEALTLVNTLISHPTSRNDIDGYGQLTHIYGNALINDGQPAKAIESFKQSLKYRPNIQTGLEQVALLGSNQHYKLGLLWLNHVEQMPRPKPSLKSGRYWDFDVEIKHLKTQLNKDLTKPITK